MHDRPQYHWESSYHYRNRRNDQQVLEDMVYLPFSIDLSSKKRLKNITAVLGHTVRYTERSGSVI